MRVTLVGALITALLIAVIATTTGSRDSATGDASAATAKETVFTPCRPGSGGGGYKVRVVGISCSKARALLPHMLGQNSPATVREGEYVYENDNGWSCLVQAVASARLSQVVCAKRAQMIVYRVS